MKKFLSVQGQNALSSLIALATLFAIVGWTLPMMANPPEWARPVGIALMVASFTMLIHLSLVCSIPLRSYDLAEAALRMDEYEKRMREGFATLRIEKVAFRGMTLPNKTGYALFMLAGACFVTFGVMDFLGYSPLLMFPQRGGGFFTVPRYVTGVMEMLFGIFAMFLAQVVFKSKFTDSIDELIKRATNVVRGNFGGKKVH